MPPHYSLAKGEMSITRPKSCSLPRAETLQADSPSTAPNSGSLIGEGVFPGAGKLSVPGYHQSKADWFFEEVCYPDWFFEGRFVTLSVLFAAVYVMQAKLIVSGGKEEIIKLSSDSEREIQASLFPFICVCKFWKEI